MIELPCREAGRFRALMRRCVVGRPRGPAPPVLLHQAHDRLTLATSFPDTTLSLRLSSEAPTEEERIVPSALLEAIEGAGAGSAAVDLDESGRIRCRWTDRGAPRESAFDAVDVGSAPRMPSQPPRMRPSDHFLLSALHECGRTTSSESIRFAFGKTQLRGKDGQIVATDGRQLLVWNGFRFPFSDNVLVPAVPVFGSRELGSQTSVRVGRAGEQFVVDVGPWSVGLKIDATARFPDVAALLATSADASLLRFSDTDVGKILQFLGGRFVRSDKEQAVRFRLSSKPEMIVAESCVPLAQSEVDGTPRTVAVSVRHLMRALQMGHRRRFCWPVANRIRDRFGNRDKTGTTAGYDQKPLSQSLLQPGFASGVSAPSDNYWFNQSPGLHAARTGVAPAAPFSGPSKGGIGELEDGDYFRRLRIQFEGGFSEVFQYNLVFKLEDSEFSQVGLDEFWVGMAKVPVLGCVRVGNVKIAEGLEGDSYSSSKAITFEEKASFTEAFYQNFGDGFWVANNLLDHRLFWAANAYRQETNNASSGINFGDGEYAYGGRLAALPLWSNDGRCFLHLATSYYWRKAQDQNPNTPGDGPNTPGIEFRARPEMRDDSPGAGGSQAVVLGNSNRMVDTGVLPASSSGVLGLEAWGNYGPLSIIGEWAWATAFDVNGPMVSGTTTTGNAKFTGGNYTFNGGYPRSATS
jgi:Phosphate-selective porin O and P